MSETDAPISQPDANEPVAERSAEELKTEETAVKCEQKDSESSRKLNELFADRYTPENADYAKIAKGFDPVVIIHPWAARPKRTFDHTNNRGRGGWRGRGGNYNNRGGGSYRGGGDNWRGRGWQGKRRHDEGGPQYRGEDARVHYPGRY